MNAVARLTAADQLALYRTHHRIEVDRAPDWNRCDVCHVRVYQVLARRWQHDPDELIRLQREAAIEEENARVAAVIEAASAPLRQFETVVVEDHGAYVVTADLEPPAHNHFDDRDAPWDIDACPRCRWDVDRAEG
jgi:hypothetical protein